MGKPRIMKKDLGTQPGDPPDLGDKLDSVSRMIARLVCESLKTKDAYNPDAERRRGDAFDISLLFYTSLPSVGLHNRSEISESP